MATMITDECINCGACEPECPNTAIYQGGVEYDWQGAKHAALSNEIFYIVPEKCTECVGFYDHEACAAVCPVDCCVPNPNIVESEAALFARAKEIHPDKAFDADFPSRFKDGGGAGSPGDAAAPAAGGAAPAQPAPAASAKPTAQVVRIGKVERKAAAPLQQPPARTTPFGGELPIDFEEALAIASPRGGAQSVPGFARLAVAALQPLLGALPASTKARLESGMGDARLFSSSGATGMNILLHLLALPLVLVAFAVLRGGDSLYTSAVRPWFFWGLVLAVAEAVVRLREAMIFARPMSEVVWRGSFYGPVLVPLLGPLLKLAERGRDSGGAVVHGYYATAGAFDEKQERERRYGEVFRLEDRDGGYVLHLELPRRIPPSGLKVELGLGDEMPDYALDLSLRGAWFEVHGRVIDARLRTVAASAPAFPPDFTTRIPLQERCIGFAYRYRDKDLDVVILKQSVAAQVVGAAHAA